jgi:hypothetical protein
MAQSAQASSPDQGNSGPTHEMNGRRNSGRQNQRRNTQKNNNFEPDANTAIENTSKYSTPVVFKSFTLKTNEMQRVQHRHTKFVGGIIHQLENATLAKYREKHSDLVREAILAVADKLDEIDIHVKKETAEMEKTLEGHESVVEQYSNPMTYEKWPVQTSSGMRWIEVLESSDALLKLYDEAVFHSGSKFDQIERAERVNALVKRLNTFPSFVSETNKGVGEQVDAINRKRAAASGKTNIK